MNDFDIPVVQDDDELVTGSNSRRWKGIMKCVPFEESRLLKWTPPFIVQPKLDGDRCLNKPMGLFSMLLSSEENQFLSVPHITQEIMDSGLYTLPIDGELYSHELFLEGGHELIHSVASRTKNLHPRHKELELWVFDIKYLYMDQVVRLTAVQELPKNLKHIKVVPYWICSTLSEVKHVYDKVIADGFEGIVIRNIKNNYEEKRSTLLMKFKPKRKDTYKVVGWKEEVTIHGEPKGRIGSLVLTSQQGDIFSVSAGLDDNDREYLWSIRDTLAGHSAMVHYQHLTNKKIPKGCFDIEVI